MKLISVIFAVSLALRVINGRRQFYFEPLALQHLH